ncbi:MAG TPA: GAF domain-containing protein [Acidimicrobiia bacterium]|nr:GAF domain-containing protein [Acidimicrobiia bacterium]
MSPADPVEAARDYRGIDIGPRDLGPCYEGAIPAIVATAAADGTPNITYLSKVHLVDDERVALSNQFFSKTARNLAENPRASLLVTHPTTGDQFRLTLCFERTERRGPVFERLRGDVDAVAAMTGMQDVFKLRAADVYRVLLVEQVLTPVHFDGRAIPGDTPPPDLRASSANLAVLTARLSRCGDLDTLVSVALEGLAELLGYDETVLLLLDERGERLYTIASRGFDAEGVGSEVAVGDGVIGMAAERCAPMRVGNLHQMSKYSNRVRRTYEEQGIVAPGREIAVPERDETESRIAVPAMVLGQLVAVLAAESPHQAAFSEHDEAILSVVAGIVASAIEIDGAQERAESAAAVAVPVAHHIEPVASEAPVRVRFFDIDGSMFLDGDYLIKGVAGRILWVLLSHYTRDGRDEFTNKEVRLELAGELPDFRDNLESRLILLKRRLDERAAPIRIEKTGRARFRVVVDGAVALEAVTASED